MPTKNKIQKYLFLLKSFAKYSLIADLEYRVNILVRFFNDIVWYLVQIAVFEVIFSHFPKLGDWNIFSMRIFMGVMFITDSVYMIFFHENLDAFSEKVRGGDLDLLLSKPVNSQFMISLQKLNPTYFANTIVGMTYLGWAIWQLPEKIYWYNVLALAMMVPAAALVIYATRFFFTGIAMFITKADSLGYIWFTFYRLGLKPHSIYPRAVQIFIMTLLPMAFVASVPAHVLIGTYNWVWVLAENFVAILFVFLTHLYWRRALRNYSSASS